MADLAVFIIRIYSVHAAAPSVAVATHTSFCRRALSISATWRRGRVAADRATAAVFSDNDQRIGSVFDSINAIRESASLKCCL